jgi:hypothetical protein
MVSFLHLIAPPIQVLEVRKVSQVTGETDRQRHVPTDNQTETRFGLWGTDLGASFEHRGELVFLFGDTWPVGPKTDDRPVDGDSIAFCTDRNPDDGLTLDFVKAADGKFKAVHIPGVSLKGFEVPNGGFSAKGHMYGIYTTEASKGPKGEVMGRSVLARSDDGKIWAKVLDLSRTKFINVSAAVVDAAKTPGLPIDKGQAVLLWASGREYRRSSPCLACVPVGRVEESSAYRYWNGSSWGNREKDAQPLFVHNEVGELSVAWCVPMKRWLMTYNSGSPRGILIRTASRPTGPWSEPVVLFDPKDGYGKFMHASNGPDRMADPYRQKEYGGEYAPYMIPRFFRKTKEGVAIYFLMSTWNPYNVVLMRAEIK